MSASENRQWVCLSCQQIVTPVPSPQGDPQKLRCPLCVSEQLVPADSPLAREALAQGTACAAPKKSSRLNPAVWLVAILPLGLIAMLLFDASKTPPPAPAPAAQPNNSASPKPAESKPAAGSRTVEQIVQEGKDAAFQAHQQRATNGDLQAQYRLGLDYRDGIGTETNLALARQWLKKAGSEGHYDAAVALKQLNSPKPAAK